jgi:hypothetical protein
LSAFNDAKDRYAVSVVVIEQCFTLKSKVMHNSI